MRRHIKHSGTWWTWCWLLWKVNWSSRPGCAISTFRWFVARQNNSSARHTRPRSKNEDRRCLGVHLCHKPRIFAEDILCFAQIKRQSLRRKYISANGQQGKTSDNQKKYISDDGVFPTNIVLNIDKNRLNFERVKQANSKTDELDSGTLGWLDIKPAYKSAWIIDGQHRLYAYSGHEKANHSHLSVLAFEGFEREQTSAAFYWHQRQTKKR